jgi:hypothetical protein
MKLAADRPEKPAPIMEIDLDFTIGLEDSELWKRIEDALLLFAPCYPPSQHSTFNTQGNIQFFNFQ